MLGLILPWWTKYAAIASLVAVSFVTGWVKGHDGEKNKLDTLVAQTKAIADAQKAKNIQIMKERKKSDDEAISNTQSAAKFLTSYFTNHPRIVRLCDATGSSGMPATAETSSSVATDHSGEGGTIETSPTESTEGLSIDLELVGSGLVKLLEMDKWIKRQEGNQ